uniref:YitT family protein n=1 Tax=Aquabacter sp. L1I39 TaxID=2820278 RepID=UPI001FFC6728|nr:YitT family protein [Aquabacter sp. L1I39]
MALLIGTALVALGIAFYTKAMLAISSMAGLALLIHYATGAQFGTVFFLLNLPFYVLGWHRLGWRFALRTFIAVGLVSLFSRFTPVWLRIEAIDATYAALVGGALMGAGMLVLFRHRTGLGGVNILALWFQEAFGIRAGWFQLCVDVAILLASLFILPLAQVLLSIAGALVLNAIIAINHQPGRYALVSP